ncbi:MAG: hypothetical protein AUI36_10380 [Cyanobacteria bacterium 13_1_40CM_2_61_4]|nr:MAG: hypothetical protein AUI36_10380 [Cyanobacteria bacterium 13_1_40CM_2_61_4]
MVAETPSIYRLDVRAPEKDAAKGRYEIKLEEVRTATAQDRSRVVAEKLTAEAMQFLSEQTAESRRKALEKFEQSLAHWQAAKDPGKEARALYFMGYTYNALADNEKALDSCNRGLPLARAAGDRKTEAYLLDTIGSAYNALGDKKKSLEFFNQALPLRRAIRDRVGETNTLNNIGMAYNWMGERSKALDYFNQVLLVLRQLGDRQKQATMLNNLCVIHTNMGEYGKALDSCNESLQIRRHLTNREGEAISLNSLANVYSSLGQYQQALDSYIQSLATYKALGERDGEAIEFNNIGWVYATLGEYQKAIDFYSQSLELLRALGDRYGEAHVLNNIAVNYATLEQYQKALAIHLQLLPLRRAQGDREGEALTFNNIANCYAELGEKQKALDYYAQSLTLHRVVGNRRLLATALRNVGGLYEKLGEHQKALECLNEALLLSRTIGDPNGDAATLSGLARLERDRGNLVEAQKFIEAALAAVESLRINVKSQQLRSSFLASVRKYYEFEIDLLMRLDKQHPAEGFDAAALRASEKGRARSLLELLSEAQAEIREGVDPSLLKLERQLQQTIADKAERQTRLLSGKYSEEQATAATKEIDALTTEFEQVQAQIRETSPRYAALTQPAPLGLKEIQSQVLDNETLLLEYALGEEKSFLWAVTPTSIQSFELAKRGDIEQAARRVFELLTARNQSIPNETPAQRKERLDQADAEYPKASITLSQMLLGPVASELKNKRLLIVSDGVLQYVPFAALPVPNDEGERMKEEQPTRRRGDTETRRIEPKLAIDIPVSPRPPVPVSVFHPSSFIPHPLIVDHEVINLPSASVLAVLRQETADRQPPSKTIAVLADPVFSSNDPRLAFSARRQAPPVDKTSPMADVQRSAAESGLSDFVRLRFSRQEAEDITRLAAGSMELKALDFAASRAVAINPDIGRYRIVHFATHGLINNQHPELSGVVLSLVDQQGHPQNGFLRLYDIYNLKLTADLVVLSACQTALGKEIKGEGLVGLTRGFMYAGAPRVVASLWRIDDRATAELMKRFYAQMLSEKLRPAAALRAAQVSMLQDKRWQAPHYWAAFTLQGEWK